MSGETRIDAVTIVEHLKTVTTSIESKVIDQQLIISQNSKIQATFTRCIFFEDVDIEYTKSGFVTFIECILKKSLRITESKLERLIIRQCEVFKLFVDNPNIKNFELSITNWGDLKIKGGEYENLIIG